MAQEYGPGLIEWSLQDVDLLDPAGLEYVTQAVNEQIKQVCPRSSSEIGFTHQNDFLVCEMSVPLYECLSGLDTDANEALGEGSIGLLTDAILGLTAVAITVLGTTMAPALSLALTIYSAVGDMEFLTNYGSTAGEKVFRRSTRVGLLGDFVSAGKIGPGRSYTPVLMVKHKSSDEVRMLDLKLRTLYGYVANCRDSGICNEYIGSKTVELGRLAVQPAKGYFVIPAQTVSFSVVDKSSEGIFLKGHSFELLMDTDQLFWDGGTRFEVAEFVPQFTFAAGSSSFGDLVFLDAGASVLPADGVAAYDWFYKNRRIGAGSTLIVRQSSFAELVDGQGSVRIQLQVTVGRSVETATQVVQLGESEAEEPDLPDDGDGLASGALASYRDFHVIAHDLDETENHDAACKGQLGSSVRLADWNDIVAYYNGGGSLPSFSEGLKLGVYGEALAAGELAGEYRLSANGASIWPDWQAHGLDRHYFLARHDHSRPDYFLAHADLDNHHLSLGSWYGRGGYALCYGGLGGGGGGSTGTVQTFTHSLEGDKSVSMDFVWVEPGTFMMGSPKSERSDCSWCDHEGPVHEVELSRGFWLGRYEVTQGEWEAVMGSNPSSYTGDSRRPVEQVSWNDVQEFIAKLNDAAGEAVYRLPTEAEWEYACRAGTTTRWSLGDEDGDDESLFGNYAWYSGNNSSGGTKAVGDKLPNGWGLHDMHGNVAEWVQDWYGEDYYNSSPRVDPPGPTSGSSRVFRGGYFYDLAPGLRSAFRYRYSPGVRDAYVGVRLLRIR